jgi:hypothetical protein
MTSIDISMFFWVDTILTLLKKSHSSSNQKHSETAIVMDILIDKIFVVLDGRVLQ